MLPETICPVPWLNLSIDVDGSSRPCCKFSRASSSDAETYGNLRTHDLQELWNSPGLVKLRTDFRAGRKPAACRTCWVEEAAGVMSYRQEFTKNRVRSDHRIDYDDPKPESPVTLDLKLSNLCNLKCRICSPTASSLFLKETLDHFDDSSEYLQSLRRDKDYFRSKKIVDQPRNLEIFKRWLKYIEHVELFGGEPFVSDEVRDIENLMISEGASRNISLLYNTNITVFREAFVERWLKFRRVIVSLSLDDIGQRLEYERAPSSWQTVRKHVLQYAAIGQPTIHVVLFCSVSVYNAWYLPEYVDWVIENVPNLSIRFNYVHNDPHFCVTNLPEIAKVEVSKRLLAKADALPEAYAGLGREMRDVVAFMNSQAPSRAHWARFKQHNLAFDRARSQRYEEAFPEFSRLLAFCEAVDPRGTSFASSEAR